MDRWLEHLRDDDLAVLTGPDVDNFVGRQGDDSGHRGFSKPSSTGSGQTRQRATEQGRLPLRNSTANTAGPMANPGTGDLEAGRQQGVDDEEEDAMATEKQKQAARR